MKLLKATLQQWWDDHTSQHGAALAFYFVLSLIPMTVLTIALANGLINQSVAEQIYAAIRENFSASVAENTINLIRSARQDVGGSLLGLAISVGGLIWSGSGIFLQLRRSLNDIWHVETDDDDGVLAAIVNRLLAFLIVLGAGPLILLLAFADALVRALGRPLRQLLPEGWPRILLEGEPFAIFVVLVLICAVVYRVLPDTDIAWADVWIGAVVTAALLMVGQMLVGWYLQTNSAASAVGIGGSVIVVLLWVYYSAQIFLFGAEFTYVQAGNRL